MAVNTIAPYLDETLFITKAGLRLRMGEVPIATAIQFYHMFQKEMRADPGTDFDNHLVAMATLFLATKIRGVSVRLGDLINTCYKCIHSDLPMLEVNDTYWQLKDSVSKMELVLLRAIKFNLDIQLPHNYLLHHLLSLSHWVDSSHWLSSSITPLSWALLQDSFHTLLHFSHTPNVMAVGVVYLSAHMTKLIIPIDGAERAWWEVMCPGVEESELQVISRTLMSLYDTMDDADTHVVT